MGAQKGFVRVVSGWFKSLRNSGFHRRVQEGSSRGLSGLPGRRDLGLE